MSKKTDDKLRYQVVFDEFLKSREWTDKYEIDVEKKEVTLITSINFSGGNSGRLIIEASDETAARLKLGAVVMWVGLSYKRP